LRPGSVLGSLFAFSRAAWSTFRPGGPDINVDADGHMSARTRKGVELLAGVGETFPEFFKRAADWADGNFPQATRASIAEHMRREVVELQDAITADTWGGSQAMRTELADVFLLLIHEARHNGLDGPQLLAAAQAKLLINQARDWGQADAQGVVEHVRTTSPMTAEKHNREHDGPIEKCHAGECQALMRELAQGVVEHVRTQGEALRALPARQGLVSVTHLCDGAAHWGLVENCDDPSCKDAMAQPEVEPERPAHTWVMKEDHKGLTGAAARCYSDSIANMYSIRDALKREIETIRGQLPAARVAAGL